MNSSDVLWLACGLVLVIEGLLPAVNPAGWRRVFEQLLQLSDEQIRLGGLFGMVVGLLIIWFFQ
ncbi:MAG: DUF2065 domain-containing protein [Burkholderiales bacterium]|nr:DUF2065 domain-containing protein [Burkholderiales bacterium]MDE2075948.1 DUF2065 domain-containing protein [Burkholderiales bacterium]MDE2433583.1 DUF2065 domain-containing protein [Burkholderiales bacterium]